MFNIEEINRLIQTRRSLKPSKMKPDQIDESIIQNILENANWAPTHGHTEPWRFKVFVGNGRKKLSDFQGMLYKKIMKGDDFKEGKYDRLIQNPLGVSHIIAICMKRQESEKLPEIEEIAAVCCAVQNMHLTATAYGITALWSSGFPTYTTEVNPFLGLGEHDKCLGFLYLGYPDTAWPEMKRGAISEKVEWIR